MSRVFVVNATMSRNDDGCFVVAQDFEPATEFGELVYLLPPGQRGPLDPEATIPLLREALSNFRSDDYLLLVGHPVYIAWAATFAAIRANGRLRTLHWQGKDRRYVWTIADLREGEAKGAPIRARAEGADVV